MGGHSSDFIIRAVSLHSAPHRKRFSVAAHRKPTRLSEPGKCKKKSILNFNCDVRAEVIDGGPEEETTIQLDFLNSQLTPQDYGVGIL